MARQGDGAKRALAALLDGKLAFRPRPDKRYEVTGKVVTGALVHLLERPQRERSLLAERQPGGYSRWRKWREVLLPQTSDPSGNRTVVNSAGFAEIAPVRLFLRA